MMIDCGEVEASHSCAVGKFDEEAIWYLQSRGMSEVDAKELLIRTHQDYILNMIPHQEIQDELKEFFQN
jgi:Fe-S cluster assembly scaffold protein SufB